MATFKKKGNLLILYKQENLMATCKKAQIVPGQEKFMRQAGKMVGMVEMTNQPCDFSCPLLNIKEMKNVQTNRMEKVITVNCGAQQEILLYEPGDDVEKGDEEKSETKEESKIQLLK